MDEDVLDGEDMIDRACNRDPLVLGRRDHDVRSSIASLGANHLRFGLIFDQSNVEAGIDETGDDAFIPLDEVVDVVGRALRGPL